jgi:hypothetical protein
MGMNSHRQLNYITVTTSLLNTYNRLIFLMFYE